MELNDRFIVCFKTIFQAIKYTFVPLVILKIVLA